MIPAISRCSTTPRSEDENEKRPERNLRPFCLLYQQACCRLEAFTFQSYLQKQSYFSRKIARMFPSPLKAPVLVLLSLMLSNVAALSQGDDPQAGWVKVPSENKLPLPMRSAEIGKAITIIESCYAARFQRNCSGVLDRFSDDADLYRWRSPKFPNVFFKIDKVSVLDAKTAEKSLSTRWRRPGNIEVEVRERLCGAKTCDKLNNFITYDFQKEAGRLYLVRSFTWPDPE